MPRRILACLSPGRLYQCKAIFVSSSFFIIFRWIWSPCPQKGSGPETYRTYKIVCCFVTNVPFLAAGTYWRAILSYLLYRPGKCKSRIIYPGTASHLVLFPLRKGYQMFWWRSTGIVTVRHKIYNCRCSPNPASWAVISVCNGLSEFRKPAGSRTLLLFILAQILTLRRFLPLLGIFNLLFLGEFGHRVRIKALILYKIICCFLTL